MVAAQNVPPFTRDPAPAGEIAYGEDTYAAIFGSLRQAPADRPFVIGQLGQSLDGRIGALTCTDLLPYGPTPFLGEPS